MKLRSTLTFASAVLIVAFSSASFAAPVDGTPCDDGNPCTTGEKYSARTCTGGINKLNSSGCDDKNPCTVYDKCLVGKCKGTPKPKPSSSNLGACQEWDFCNKTTGEFTTKNKQKGTNCDDKNICTGDDKCIAGGSCLGTLITNDNNPCTVDSCDQATGVLHVAKACAALEVCNPATGNCEKETASPCNNGEVMGWKQFVGSDGKDIVGIGYATFVSYNGNLCIGFAMLGGISCYKDGKWQPFNKGFPVYAETSPEVPAIGVMGLQELNGALFFAGWWVKSPLTTPSDLFEGGTKFLEEKVDYGLYQATEGGEWHGPVSVSPKKLAEGIASFNDKIYVVTTDGVYSYSNEVWANEGLAGKSVTKLYSDGTNLYAGTKDGVQRYNNGAWENIGLNGENIYSIFKYDSSIFATTTAGMHRLEGNNWKKIDSIGSGGYSFKPVIHEEKLYIGKGVTVSYSTNDLSNWKDESLGLGKWDEGGIDTLAEHNGNLYLLAKKEGGLGGYVTYQYGCIPPP